MSNQNNNRFINELVLGVGGVIGIFTFGFITAAFIALSFGSVTPTELTLSMVSSVGLNKSVAYPLFSLVFFIGFLGSFTSLYLVSKGRPLFKDN